MQLVLFSLLIFFLAILVDAKAGEKRIDEDPTYFVYQDIRKALDNKDRISWLFYRTYQRSTSDAKHICVYSIVKERKEDDSSYEFEQGYALAGKENEKVNTTLYATPYKTEPHTHQDREKENAMTVSREKDSATGRKYQLIYSNYNSCDILRVLDQNGGHACELYLHDHAADGGVPSSCESIYGNACGKDDGRYKQKVYDESCREKIGFTTEAPTTPEETSTVSTKEQPEEGSTTSTLPPGC